MANRYQIWDKGSDVYTPSGKKFTAAEWAAKYSWVKIPTAKMIVTAGVINGGCAMEFEATKAHYKKLGAQIEDGMTDEQVLEAIEEFEDNPPNSGESTAEERTAAALEALVMNNMPNVNDDDPDEN